MEFKLECHDNAITGELIKAEVLSSGHIQITIYNGKTKNREYTLTRYQYRQFKKDFSVGDTVIIHSTLKVVHAPQAAPTNIVDDA